MYTFLKPRYEFYPYSQHDIPPTPQYHTQHNQFNYMRHYPTALVESDRHYYSKQGQSAHTSVEVQPSHSYEIKQTEHGYQTIFHGNDAHSTSNYDHGNDAHTAAEPVPVIVLRVPGATKYAAHLQTLLQQYLEARAAQYIQALQEQEAHGIDGSQQINHESEQDINAYGALPVLPYQAYVPAQMYIQPINQIQPYFGQQEITNPYANAHIAQTIESDDEQAVATPSPINYYSHAQVQAPVQAHDEVDHNQGKHFQYDFIPSNQ